jgi:hypothetical protein
MTDYKEIDREFDELFGICRDEPHECHCLLTDQQGAEVLDFLHSKLNEAEDKAIKMTIEKAGFAVTDILTNDDYMGGFRSCEVQRKVEKKLSDQLLIKSKSK